MCPIRAGRVVVLSQEQQVGEPYCSVAVGVAAELYGQCNCRAAVRVRDRKSGGGGRAENLPGSQITLNRRQRRGAAIWNAQGSPAQIDRLPRAQRHVAVDGKGSVEPQ